MKIAVVGLWHLGSVTAAALTELGHQVIGYDEQDSVVQGLRQAQLPVQEPNLEALVRSALAAGKLSFTSQVAELNDAEVFWICYDTPVDADDVADTDFVHQGILKLARYLRPGATLIVSSQMPLGTMQRLQKDLSALGVQHVHYASVPENLRLGKALDVFLRPDRIVVGARDEATRAIARTIYGPLAEKIIFMSIESAEATKHAINAFLATSVTFINELASICEVYGADALEVEKGLKSDLRIGPFAYLKAGAAFAGGTLARDIQYLSQLARDKNLQPVLFQGVWDSNHQHRMWPLTKLRQILPELKQQAIGLLGLTYKVGTNTLRRSWAVELANQLAQAGARVTAYDPEIPALPVELKGVMTLASSPLEVLQRSTAVVVATPWPIFRDLRAKDFETHLSASTEAPADFFPSVLDPIGFFAEELTGLSKIKYYRVGKNVLGNSV